MDDFHRHENMLQGKWLWVFCRNTEGKKSIFFASDTANTLASVCSHQALCPLLTHCVRVEFHFILCDLFSQIHSMTRVGLFQDVCMLFFIFFICKYLIIPDVIPATVHLCSGDIITVFPYVCSSFLPSAHWPSQLLCLPWPAETNWIYLLRHSSDSQVCSSAVNTLLALFV